MWCRIHLHKMMLKKQLIFMLNEARWKTKNTIYVRLIKTTHVLRKRKIVLPSYPKILVQKTLFCYLFITNSKLNYKFLCTLFFRFIPILNKFKSRWYNNQKCTYKNYFLFIVLIIVAFSLSRNVSFKRLPITLIAFKHFANVTILRFIANKILSVSFLTFYWNRSKALREQIYYEVDDSYLENLFEVTTKGMKLELHISRHGL